MMKMTEEVGKLQEISWKQRRSGKMCVVVNVMRCNGMQYVSLNMLSAQQSTLVVREIVFFYVPPACLYSLVTPLALPLSQACLCIILFFLFGLLHLVTACFSFPFSNICLFASFLLQMVLPVVPLFHAPPWSHIVLERRNFRFPPKQCYNRPLGSEFSHNKEEKMSFLFI